MCRHIGALCRARKMHDRYIVRNAQPREMSTRIAARLSAINPSDIPNPDSIGINVYSQRSSRTSGSGAKTYTFNKSSVASSFDQQQRQLRHPVLANPSKKVRKVTRDVALIEAIKYVQDIVRSLESSTDNHTADTEIDGDDDLSDLLKILIILKERVQDKVISSRVTDEKCLSSERKHDNESKELKERCKVLETALNNMRFSWIEEKNKVTSAQLRLDDNDNYVNGIKRHYEEDISELHLKVKCLQTQIDKKNCQLLEIPTLEEKYIREARKMVAEKSVEVALKDIEMRSKLSELDQLVYWRNRCGILEAKLKELEENVKLANQQNRSNVTYFQKTYFDMLSRPPTSPDRISPLSVQATATTTAYDDYSMIETTHLNQIVKTSRNNNSSSDTKVFAATNNIISHFPKIEKKQKAVKLLEDEIRSLRLTNVALLSKCGKLGRLVAKAREAPLRHLKYSADDDYKSVELDKKPQHIVGIDTRHSLPFNTGTQHSSFIVVLCVFLSQTSLTLRRS